MGEPQGQLPVDDPLGENDVSSAQAVRVSLDVEATDQLLGEVPPVYGTEINEVLLTALVRAFHGWSGVGQLLIDLEGHGREEVVDGVDLTRTVGWFTTHFPVLLTAAGEPGENLKHVKETLRQIPGRGIGYGALRYLAGDPVLAAELRAKLRPQVKFNYLGRLDRALPEGVLFLPCWDQGGEARSPRGRRSHLLEINGGVRDGRLEMSFGYSANLHHTASITELSGAFLGALSELIDHCRMPGAGGYTPADFPDANLDQKSLDAVIARISQRNGARVD
jgi:non-ribosomal peptide synthase protein (TIGR01720 family)